MNGRNAAYFRGAELRQDRIVFQFTRREARPAPSWCLRPVLRPRFDHCGLGPLFGCREIEFDRYDPLLWQRWSCKHKKREKRREHGFCLFRALKGLCFGFVSPVLKACNGTEEKEMVSRM